MAITQQWVMNPVAGPVTPRFYKEGTSETFAVGALVIYDDSEDGIVEIGTASGVPSAQNQLGIALKAATGTAGSLIPVHLIQASDVFSASLASNETTDVAPATDDRGNLYGIIKMTTGEWVVDNGNTNWVKVIDLDPADVEFRSGEDNLVAGDKVLFQYQVGILDNTGNQA